ncbi:GNAT family N-acetyltransferase [Nonomuraea sp. NPDC049421]|uniref:GNAT family N-acetyltransferase n=1 Tax=Nonomuraea sp. NPDC049421 TaxID=3155275 RepID=UPI0034282436
MTEIEVRRATEADAVVLARLNEIVHALHVEARPDVFVPAGDKEEVARLFVRFLGREGALAFLAEEAGRAVGYVTGVVHRREGDVMMRARSFVSIEHIAVDPEVARSGVGSALARAVREAGRAAGCTSVLTDVWDFNEAALAFFAELGFRPMRHHLEQAL